MKHLLLFIVIFSVLIAGCAQTDPLAGYCGENEKPVVFCEPVEDEELDIIILEPEDTTGEDQVIEGPEEGIVEEPEIPEEEITEEDVEILEEEVSEETPEEIEYAAEREYIEGDLVSFADLKVKDPDQDDVIITYSEPLNNEGEWQTSEGDAGEYTIMITASDGKLEVMTYAKVVVIKGNTAPVIDAEEHITVMEGEELLIESTVTDPDGDEVTISYEGWITEPIYTTTYDDAGEYAVTIVASDGKTETRKEVKITVIEMNRAPVIDELTYDIIALEGDLVELALTANDADGDVITFDYEAPFDTDGKWQTEKGDAGEYSVTVTASDGIDTNTMEVPVSVESTNSEPVLEAINDIVVKEGETISIEVVASDADGDELAISFSGWMTDSSYTTDYNDAGEYTVTVSVSDGTVEVSQEVKITVEDINRPPEFVWG